MHGHAQPSKPTRSARLVVVGDRLAVDERRQLVDTVGMLRHRSSSPTQESLPAGSEANNLTLRGSAATTRQRKSATKGQEKGSRSPSPTTLR